MEMAQHAADGEAVSELHVATLEKQAPIKECLED